MEEQLNTAARLPEETLTPKNIELAVKNLDGMTQSMEAMVAASQLPENRDFAERLLDRALELYEIGRAMNAASPV